MSYLVPTVIDKTDKGERAYDIYSRLLEERIIYLGTQVDDNSASNVIAQLLFLDYKDPGKDITMYINSPGGSVTAGLGIYDTMNLVKADVMTVCVGQAASMGAFLLSAGAKGKRYATPSSTIMIHQPLGGTGRAQATDIAIQAAEIKRLKEYLTSILAENANKPYEEMYEACERDNFMSAQAALDFGLIDAIVGKKQERKVESFRGAVNH